MIQNNNNLLIFVNTNRRYIANATTQLVHITFHERKTTQQIALVSQGKTPTKNLPITIDIEGQESPLMARYIISFNRYLN